jgi:hypothetical protein
MIYGYASASASMHTSANHSAALCPSCLLHCLEEAPILSGCNRAIKCSFVRAGHVHFASGSNHAQIWLLCRFLGVSIFTVSIPKIQPLVCIPKILRGEKTLISETAVGPCQKMFNSERPGVTHAKNSILLCLLSHLPPNKSHIHAYWVYKVFSTLDAMNGHVGPPSH